MSQKRVKKIKSLYSLQNTSTDENEYGKFAILNLLKENWKFLVCLCFGIIFLYSNSLSGNFVSDDYATIPNNPLIDNFGLSFQSSFISLSNYFIYKLFGLTNSFPFHVFNLFLYLVTIILIFVFGFLLSENKIVSQITTLFFAIMPVHVEAVSWISGKPYLFLAISFLISMIFLILLLKTGNKKYVWLLILSVIVGLLIDKMRFLSFVFIAIVYALSYDWKNKVKTPWLKVILVGIIFLVMVVFLAWPAILVRITAVNSGTNVSDSLFYDPFFQYPTAISKYLQLLWFPIDLTLYHTMYIFPNWLNWSIFLSYLTMSVYFYFKNKKYFFALAFIFVASAPSMAPIKVSWLVAERYIFLGSFGFSLFLAYLLYDLSKYLKLIPLTLFISLFVLLIVRTYLRNIDWQTNHNLWVAACQVSPNSHNAWNNIGDDYDKLKDYPNAIKGFTQSTIVKPNYADAFHNRANIFYKLGRLDLARESYEIAIKINPNLFQTYMSLVQIDLMEKNYNRAVQDANTLLKFNINNSQSWFIMGLVQIRIGDIEGAKTSMKKVLELDPSNKSANEALLQLSVSVTGE